MGTVKDADSNRHGVADPNVSYCAQLVTVNVGSGKDAESWTIHKSLLAHHSPFFAAAFNGNFAESATNTVSLVEDHPDAFQLFVQWLYSGEIACDLDDEDDLPNVLCLAWALGDKLQCPVFQDRAMVQLLAYFKYKWITVDTMRLIYNISPSGSKLRSFAADDVFYDLTINRYPEIGADGIMGVEEFNRDLLERLVVFDRTEAGEGPWYEGSPHLKVLDFEECRVEREIE